MTISWSWMRYSKEKQQIESDLFNDIRRKNNKIGINYYIMETPLFDRMHKTIYICELSQGLWKSILGLWWSGGLFLASKGYIDKIWAWEQWFFHEKSEKKGILWLLWPIIHVMCFWQNWRFFGPTMGTATEGFHK